jgi:hypothetical protein
MEGSRSFEEADGETEKSWAGTPSRKRRRKKSWARSAVRGKEKNGKLYNF